MGNGTFTRQSYANHLNFTAKDSSGRFLSREEVFKQRSIHTLLDPKAAKLRESRDSADSPLSRAIILALDVTGSMGVYADRIAKVQLGELMESLFEKSPVKNPHVMLMGVGDINTRDKAPLQVSQFEADIRIAEQLQNLWLEGGGGGNNTESYDLPWYFAANHTAIDCFEKRGEKGFLFTIGDEPAPVGFSGASLKSLINASETEDFYKPPALYKAACEKYHAFHIVIEEGDYFKRADSARVLKSWDALIGKRLIRLDKHQYLPQVITAVIRVAEGEDPQSVVDSYPECTASVMHALSLK